MANAASVYQLTASFGDFCNMLVGVTGLAPAMPLSSPKFARFGAAGHR